VAGPASSEACGTWPLRSIAAKAVSNTATLADAVDREPPTSMTSWKPFADQIDGLWASTLSEASILATIDAYELSATKLRT